MEIKNSKILVLGGWGLVGAAICKKLMEHSPKLLVVTSLRKEEAEDAVMSLRKEYPQSDPSMFVADWGNVFTRTEFKDISWDTVLKDQDSRNEVISDIFDELSDGILEKSALYTLIAKYKPDLVIDCINTATAIAYQDIYNTTNAVRRGIKGENLTNETVERMMASDYIPQLIRHVQIFNKALNDNKCRMYLKIGTSGTGGMGLNIPYTHSEERPSRVLLAKAAVAGAQSLLLFLMARTPNGPIVKEIKPTAAIAWKKIAYDKVYRKGKPIPLVDMNPQNACSVGDIFKFNDSTGVTDLGKDFESVFIDTGENGIFSKAEFQAISSIGQMEIVTPEEIATLAVFEILGGNSGHDIIQGLDSFSLGPTYRGGMLQNKAMKKLNQLENQHGVSSIAFELLGPPRLSKLLYEAHLLKNVAGSLKEILDYSPEDLSRESLKLVSSDEKLRAEMLSIGLVILLPDGKTYLRGKDVKIPANTGEGQIPMNAASIDKWCEEAWIDLRFNNFGGWQERIKKIIAQAESVPNNETGSGYTYTMDYWDNFESVDEGKLAGWIFEFEDKGWRFKR